MLRFYDNTPTDDIFLLDLEKICIERFQTLRYVRACRFRRHENGRLSSAVLQTINWKDQPFAYLLHLHEHRNYEDNESEQDWLNRRKMDLISHHILRLLFCKNSELQKWFLDRETELFEFRFYTMSEEDQESFFANSDEISYREFRAEEVMTPDIVYNVYDVTEIDDRGLRDLRVFEVDFEEAWELVRTREAYLNAGKLYMVANQRIVQALQFYRGKLRKGLELFQARIDALDDERVLDLLKKLEDIYTEVEKRQAGLLVSSQHLVTSCDELDELSVAHFPPCMRQIHEHFRTVHHMNYFQRLQYGLFLKSIGLPFQEAVQFWKPEFTQLMPEEHFYKKRYYYEVQYQHGLVGNRPDSKCLDCERTDSLGRGASRNPKGSKYGCPFVNYNDEQLRDLSGWNNLRTTDVADIEDLVHRNLPGLACGKFLACQRGFRTPRMTENLQICNPTQFYELSRLGEERLDDEDNTSEEEVEDFD